jgi:hypothetical protein
MKKLYILTSLFVALTLSSVGQILLDENFEYGSTSGNLTALTNNWVLHSGGPNPNLVYLTTSLSVAGYPPSAIGGSAYIDATQFEDANRMFAEQTTGTFYYSALIKIESAIAAGGYFFHVGETTSGTAVSNFSGRVFAKENGSGMFNVGIGNTNTATYGTNSYNYNETYLFVVKYNITSGEMKVFVLSSGLSTEPASSEVSSTETSSATKFNTIAIRQSNNTTGNGSVTAVVDGIRVATTWEDLFEPYPASLTADVTSSENATCSYSTDGSVTIEATGGETPYTYLWETGETSNTLGGLGVGAHGLNVTITDASTTLTAVETINVTITGPAAIDISGTITAENCGANDGEVAITITGGSGTYTTYLWSNGQTTMNASGLSSGNVSVTVEDSNGCVGSESFLVTSLNGPSISFGSISVTCSGKSDGQLTATVTGGTTPYSFDWSNGATTETISGLASGIYDITVVDNGGCTSTSSITLGYNSSTNPTINVVVSNNVSCNGGSNGEISGNLLNGASPYQWIWNNGNTTSSFTDATAQVYMVTITDNNGCVLEGSNTVTEPSAISVTLSSTNITTSGGSDGAISSSVNGGTAGYTYLWSNSATTSAISGLVAGVYDLTVTDNNSCAKIVTATVTEPAGIVYTPIYDIQYVTDPATNDASPLVDQIVNVKGIVSAYFTKGSTKGYFIQDAKGAWNGIFVFDPTNVPVRGDSVLITGKVAEYFGSTQLGFLTSYTLAASGKTPYAPEVISTADVSLEEYEGVLIKVKNAECEVVASGATFGVWDVNDGSGTAKVENDMYPFTATLGTNYDVTGLGYYSFETRFIMPRDADDVSITSGIMENKLASNFNVYPNPAKNNVQIEVKSTTNITIYNSIGVLVFERTVNKDVISIDIQNWSSGIYVIQSNDGASISSQKLIVK